MEQEIWTSFCDLGKFLLLPHFDSPVYSAAKWGDAIYPQGYREIRRGEKEGGAREMAQWLTGETALAQPMLGNSPMSVTRNSGSRDPTPSMGSVAACTNLHLDTDIYIKFKCKTEIQIKKKTK